MSRKFVANGIGLGIFAVILAIAFIRPFSGDVEIVAGKDPQLVGEMRNFKLIKTRVSRPDFTWTDGDGKTISLADFDGKVVLVNYWASWCEICTRELPTVDNLQNMLGGEKFAVVAMNVDINGKGIAVRHMKRLALKYLDLYLDTPQTTMQRLGLQVMPTTYLFNQRGNLLGLIRGGAEWDSREAKALIQYFVDNPDYVNRFPNRERPDLSQKS
ncbi:MAG: TlpA disulfide reductase family protein [Proteobacteria bacterium]|nr:TlpA disulfide reductase family protein [Pseudomonadota bacterium]